MTPDEGDIAGKDTTCRGKTDGAMNHTELIKTGERERD
jgi:hypothetical protein